MEIYKSMKKSIRIKYTHNFIEFVKSDNVIKVKDGYIEQLSQYSILHKDLEQLYKFYQKEFQSN